MLCDEYAWQRHFLRQFPEALDQDSHGGNPGFFGDPCDVSHGHVAHRSDGNQEQGIDAFLFEASQPLRSTVFD